MTTYRAATEREINNIASKLNQYNLWFNAKSFIQQYYADTAFSFDVEVEGEYNDEGGTYYRTTGLNVYDDKGKGVYYDYTKPAFEIAFADEPSLLTQDDDFDDSYITEYLEEYYDGHKHGLVNWDDIPSVDSYDEANTKFFVDSFSDVPTLYIAVEE